MKKNTKTKEMPVLIPGGVVRGIKLTGVLYFGDQETRGVGRRRYFTQAPATAVLSGDKLTADYKVGADSGTLEVTAGTGTWKEGDYTGTLTIHSHAIDGKKHLFTGSWKDATAKPEAPCFFDLDEASLTSAKEAT